MIARMLKTYVVAETRDRDRLLAALQELGVVHLAPVDPSRAVPDAETVAAMERLHRAIQMLESVRAAGSPVALEPLEAAAEVLRIQRESVERSHRLAALHLQSEQAAIWGDMDLADVDVIARAGLDLAFYAVPRAAVGQVRAECVQPLHDWPGKRVLVAVANRRGEIEVPEGSEAIPLPPRDRPSIRAEAAEIDAALKSDTERLAGLVHLAPAMHQEHARLKAHAAWTVATRSALSDPNLYALQGWIPADRAEGLAPGLAAEGVEAAVQSVEPPPDEQPPTLIQYAWWNRWAKPMEGLFKILGTVPGYAEFDVSTMFMIFLPIFSAILISDAGYGLLYLLLPLVFYHRLAAMNQKALAQLMMVVGGCAFAWGILTASFFGFSLCEWPLLGDVMPQPIISVDMKRESMDFLMRLSIMVGAIHLALAHLWKVKAAFPKLNFLSEVGWAIWFYGIYGLVGLVLVGGSFDLWQWPYYPWGLIVGGSLAILFAAPDRNLLKMLGLGLANFPLSAIGSFGDTMSYLRLWAIGLAGSVLALSFYTMTADLPIYITIPIVAAGNALNIALSLIALMVHGVRLNMLEFANNLGMQWNGYSYEPFSRNRGQET